MENWPKLKLSHYLPNIGVTYSYLAQTYNVCPYLALFFILPPIELYLHIITPNLALFGHIYPELHYFDHT